MKPEKLSFEQQHDDGSGVRAAVRYDSTQMSDECIEIERINTIHLSVEEIDWYVERLLYIKNMIKG